MRRIILFPALLGVLLCLAPDARARDIFLQPGESVQLGEARVTCVEPAALAPLRLKDCQYWDDYAKTCLHERQTLSFEKLSCVEECQHWDSYRQTCLYATTCQFNPAQKLFVRTSCAEFDSYAQHCLKTSQEKVGP